MNTDTLVHNSIISLLPAKGRVVLTHKEWGAPVTFQVVALALLIMHYEGSQSSTKVEPVVQYEGSLETLSWVKEDYDRSVHFEIELES